MGYVCDTHPDQAAALLVTNLGNGDVAALCGPCIHPWAAAIAAATDPAGQPAEAGPGTDAETDADTDEDDASDSPVPPVPVPGPDPETGGDPVDPAPNPAAHPDGDQDGDEDPEARGFSDATVSAALGEDGDQDGAGVPDTQPQPAGAGL